jgi:hypothetical protein
MNVFKAVGDFFKSVFFPKVQSFLKAVFNKAVQAAVAEVQDIVRDVVKELSYETITNSEKRNEAYKRVVAELKASGKEVKENVIRATIELAVLELKNTTGVTDEQK